MVKIIIELDENYIEQKTNVKNLVETTEEGNVLSVLADIMSFMSLKKQIEEGQTEFFLSRESLKDKEKKLFDRTISYMVGLSCVISEDDKKGEE